MNRSARRGDGESETHCAEAIRNRLLWRSRRGMLELDLLLQGFIEKQFDILTPPQIDALSRLLEISDDVLLDFLLRRSIPTDPPLAALVAAIRESANGLGSVDVLIRNEGLQG